MLRTVRELALDELIGGLESRLPDLVARTVAQILDEMPLYRAGDVIPLDDLQASVAANLATVVHDLAHPDALDLSQARRTGQLRAEQGAPLPEVLRAYRIGFSVVWRALVELVAANPGADPGRLIGAANTIWYLMDEYAEALTEEYRETTAAHVRVHEHHRLALVEALFAGGSVTHGRLWELARSLDLPLDGTFVVAAAETLRLGEEALPDVERRLRAVHHASAWRLTPDVQVGIVSLGEAAAEGVVVEVLRADLQARLGISPVFLGLDNTAQALHLACAALASLPRGRTGAVQFDRSPLTVLVAAAPEASVQMANHVLGPLLDLPAAEREVLLETLRAWFDCQGSTRLIAEHLFCHPNTVRYRLRRICAALGRSLSDPADIADLGAALRALRAFPNADRMPIPRST